MQSVCASVRLPLNSHCHGPRMRATQVVSTGIDGSRAFHRHLFAKRELGGPHSRAMTVFVWVVSELSALSSWTNCPRILISRSSAWPPCHLGQEFSCTDAIRPCRCHVPFSAIDGGWKD
jgi:hypothetical protein